MGGADTKTQKNEEQQPEQNQEQPQQDQSEEFYSEIGRKPAESDQTTSEEAEMDEDLLGDMTGTQGEQPGEMD